METKKYKYSAAQMLTGVAGLSFLEIIMYIGIIDRNVDSRSWSAFSFLSLIIMGRLIYLSIMYYVPCLLNKTALELDDEKLQSFITGKLLFQIPPGSIYWKDIDDIEYVTSPGFGGFVSGRSVSIISFKMKDGSAAGISTRNISGNDKEIYQTITAYFEKYR